MRENIMFFCKQHRIVYVYLYWILDLAQRGLPKARAIPDDNYLLPLDENYAKTVGIYSPEDRAASYKIYSQKHRDNWKEGLKDENIGDG